MSLTWILIWLMIIGVDGECPSFSQAEIDKSCPDTKYCLAPTLKGGKPAYSCPEEMQMEGRESASHPWELVSDAKCADSSDIVATRAQGRSKSFGYDEIRCTGPVCSHKYKEDNTNCPGSDNCPAIIKEKRTLSCPAGSTLEAFNDKERTWFFIKSIVCIGEKMDVTSLFGKKPDLYRCRSPRNCDIDKYKSDDCRFNQKCELPFVADTNCEDNQQLQVSFTATVHWMDIDRNALKCSDTKELYVIQKGISPHRVPLNARCVRDADCEVTVRGIFDTFCQKEYSCSPPKITTTGLTCNEKGPHLIYRDGAALIRPDYDCFNKDIFKKGSETKLGGKFHCRSSSTNDMSEFYKSDECDLKDTCSMPENKLDATKYKCGHADDSLLARVLDDGQWISLTSLEYRNGIFVMIKTTGDDPYVPVQFTCRRKAICEVDLSTIFEENECPTGDKCQQPTTQADKNHFACDTSSAIEIRNLTGEPWREPAEMDCYNGVMRALTRTHSASGVQEPRTFAGIFRCRELRKCVISKYYDATKCDNTEVCHEPDETTLKCSADYTLQYKSIETEPWEDAPIVVCENDRYVLKDGAVARDEIPIRFRCMLKKKCDLKHYYFPSDCSTGSDFICAPPTSGPTLTCPSYMVLRVRPEKTNADWDVVESITCNNDEFIVTKRENEAHPFPMRIQCIRKECSNCENPCPTCFDLKIEPAVSEWNTCRKLKCGSSKRVLSIGPLEKNYLHEHDKPLECIGQVGTVDQWKASDNTAKVYNLNGETLQCLEEKLCTQKTPLVSECARNDHNCGTLSIRSYGYMHCSGDMIVRDPTRSDTVGNDMKCNLRLGFWTYTKNNGGEGKIETSGHNVFCKYKDCVISTLFTESCPEHQDCERPTVDGAIYECPKEYGTYMTYDMEFWEEKGDQDSGKFMCCQGNIVQVVKDDSLNITDVSCFYDVYQIPSSLRVKCAKQKLCMARTPLTSICPKGVHGCTTVKFNDYETIKCSGKKELFVEGGDQPTLERLSCDRITGFWEGTDESENAHSIEEKTNVYCANKKSAAIVSPSISNNTVIGLLATFGLLIFLILILYVYFHARHDQWLHSVVKETVEVMWAEWRYKRKKRKEMRGKSPIKKWKKKEQKRKRKRSKPSSASSHQPTSKSTMPSSQPSTDVPMEPIA